MRSLVLFTLLALGASARAEVLLGQQGHLIGPEDAAVEGTKALTFRLYSKSDGTLPDVVWEETYDVLFKGGNYGVLLGDTRNGKKALPVDKVSGDRWLAVVVDNTELLPRLQLGVVPAAANAAALGGKAADLYALKTDVAPDSDQLGGKDAALYALKTDVAPDAAKLGGTAADLFALKTDVAPDALLLGGKAPELFALKTDVAPDASKLGGKAADLFALKTDVAPDASKLGGVAATALLDGNGKILASALPATVPQLVSGKLPTSTLPTLDAGALAGSISTLAPVFFEAEAYAAGGSATAGADATASGGQRVLASASGAAGRAWGAHKAQLLATTGAKQWGIGTTLVTARVKVTAVTSTAALAVLNCSAFRGATPAWVLAGPNVSVIPSTFVAGTWTTVQAICEFRPDDADQFVGFENFTTGVTDLAIDWVSAVPFQRKPPRSCREVLDSGLSRGDGVYTLVPSATIGSLSVYCDMTTAGGGWTLIAAGAGDTNMPKFGTTASTPCQSASPSAACFVGAAALAQIPYAQVAWSTGATATHTQKPLMQPTGNVVPQINATCANDTEYYRFEQNSIAEGAATWSGCIPTEIWSGNGGGYTCAVAAGPVFNLLSCSDIFANTDSTARSSFDYNCSPFGKYGNVCTNFIGMRHWRR